MIGFALLLLIAAVAFAVSQRFRIPVIPLLLLGGLSLSLAAEVGHFEGLHHALEPEFLQSILQLGLTFLVFAAGVELNPKRIGSQRKAAWWVGIVQFVAAGAIGFILAMLLGFEDLSLIYLALTLSTSSTLVVLNQLRAWLRIYEPFARMVTGVLLLQDLIMIICIVLLSSLELKLNLMVQQLLSVLSLGGLSIAMQQVLMPWFVLRFKIGPRFKTRLPKGTPPRFGGETLLLFVVAVLFSFIGLANWLGIPTIAGAFFAGFSFSCFPLNGLVRSITQSVYGFFTALFFTALGALIIIPSMELLLKGLALALAILIITPPLVTWIAERTGMTSRYAIESGLLLAQTSELSFVLGLSGLLLGHISNEVFSLISLIGVTTMSVTPLIAHERTAAMLLHWHPSRRLPRENNDMEDHVIILGFGAGGMWVLKPLLKAGYKVVVVDDDPVIIEQLKKMDILAIRGDGSDERVLSCINARKARVILSGMRRIRDAERLLSHVESVPVIVRCFERHQAKAIESLGGIPVLNSEAALETFMDWFSKCRPVEEESLETSPS